MTFPFFVTKIWRERIKILGIHCPDMLGTNYNFDYICSDKRGLLPLMIVPCTDIIGSNDIFVAFLHWYVGKY